MLDFCEVKLEQLICQLGLDTSWQGTAHFSHSVANVSEFTTDMTWFSSPAVRSYPVLHHHQVIFNGLPAVRRSLDAQTGDNTSRSSPNHNLQDISSVRVPIGRRPGQMYPYSAVRYTDLSEQPSPTNPPAHLNPPVSITGTKLDSDDCRVSDL
ncbi:unnamed protein product [Lota lota]